jgi:hypothetical protein
MRPGGFAMNAKLVLEYAMFTNIGLAIAGFVIMYRKGYLKKYWALSSFLLLIAVSDALLTAMLFFRKDLGLTKELAYDLYCTTSWVASGLQYALILLMIYGVFANAMKPMKGLHRIGGVLFRWVSGVSILVVLGITTGPHLGGGAYLITISAEIQEAISILTLCLLLFVCLAIRPLGLTFRSHIFGVSLGLGIFATGSLIESVWCTSVPHHNPYASLYAFGAIVSCAVLLTWGTYFAMPEPERKMVLLPTTSPYFLWNSISEALGDQPGYVAVAGFKPDMLAPTEMAMLKVSSRRAAARAAKEQFAAEEEFEMRKPVMSERPAVQAYASMQ